MIEGEKGLTVEEGYAEEGGVERAIGRAREGKRECEGDRKTVKQNSDERNSIEIKEIERKQRRRKTGEIGISRERERKEFERER